MTTKTKTPPPLPVLKRIAASVKPRLPEVGKIKIGGIGPETKSKGGVLYRPPIKFDHIVVTTLEREGDDHKGNFIKDAEIHKAIGNDEPKEIPIRLLFNDVESNFPSQHICYKGKTVYCRGDGENAIRDNQGIECPCERLDPDYDAKKGKCKLHGVLTCMLPAAKTIGGVYKHRTTSTNATDGMTYSMLMIRQMTGGILFNIPLKLVMTDKLSTDHNGKQHNIKFLRLEYEGNENDLLEAAIRIKQLSEGNLPEPKQLESMTADIPADEVELIADEYHNEVQCDDDGVVIETPDADLSVQDGKPLKEAESNKVDAASGDVTGHLDIEVPTDEMDGEF